MIEVGRLAMKIAGRDAGKKCVIVDVLDSNYVLVDGETRRRKCNIAHLEPLTQTITLSKNAAHDVVAKEFEKLGFGIWKTKPRKTPTRVLPVRKYDPGKVKKETKKQEKVADKKVSSEAKKVEKVDNKEQKGSLVDKK
jgi:large subunit ribosomal protein L14e